MGGRGSGRRSLSNGKGATEDAMPLDIRRLARAGILTPGRIANWQWLVNDRPYASIQIRTEAWQVTLSFTHTPRDQPAEFINQIVIMEATPCTFGGERRWFTCTSCRQRVAVIYGAGRLFSCRGCKSLAYASQNETDDDRAARRVDRIRKSLGWVPGLLNGPGVKPKGMRRSTYERLRVQHDVDMVESLKGIARRLGFLYRLIGDEFGSQKGPSAVLNDRPVPCSLF